MCLSVLKIVCQLKLLMSEVGVFVDTDLSLTETPTLLTISRTLRFPAGRLEHGQPEACVFVFQGQEGVGRSGACSTR